MIVTSGHEHIPVLEAEVLQHLIKSPHGTYLDATFGRGGHTRGMLARLSETARVIAIDRDREAINSASDLAKVEPRLKLAHSKFSELTVVLKKFGCISLDGVLMDLGVSSPQLDKPERGFSFQKDGPLDMRMDQSTGMTASQWLNNSSTVEIAKALRDFGGEEKSQEIAEAISKNGPITRTTELSELVVKLKPGRNRTNLRHPATKTFQALRMCVNSEREELSIGLRQAFEHLRLGGRLAVISFHSDEDRQVKSLFFELAGKIDKLPRRLPIRHDMVQPKAKLIVGPLRAGAREIRINPRSRSANLRVIEKIIAPGSL